MRTITFMPVRVSPAPRRQALPTAVQARRGITAPTIRRKRAEDSAASPVRFIASTIRVAEELNQHERDDSQAKAHREGLAAEPVGLVGPPRPHRAGHQGRSADRADAQERPQEPEQVAGDRHAGQVLGREIPAGDDRVREADQVEQRLLDEDGSGQPEDLPADRRARDGQGSLGPTPGAVLRTLRSPPAAASLKVSPG